MNQEISFFRRYLFVPLGLISAVVIYVTLSLAQPELPPPPVYEAPGKAEVASDEPTRPARPALAPKGSGSVAETQVAAPSVEGPLTQSSLAQFESDPLRFASEANLRLVRDALKKETDPKERERLRSVHMMMADGLHDPDLIMRAEAALEAIAKSK